MEKLWFSDVKCSDLIENKHGKIRYIPWAKAIDRFRGMNPEARFEVIAHKSGDVELPYLKTEVGFFVHVRVSLKERVEEIYFPVMDNKMKALQKPTARDISDSIQRAFVKCLAFGFGFGLECWEKEDVMAQSSVGADDFKYRLQTGRDKGRALAEMDRESLRNYAKWLQDKGDLKGTAHEDFQQIVSHLKSTQKPAKLQEVSHDTFKAVDIFS